MDSFLVLMLVFVGTCLVITGLVVLLGWAAHKVMARFGGLPVRANTHQQPQQQQRNHNHTVIPILEAEARKPPSHGNIESTCIVFLPSDAHKANTPATKQETKFVFAMEEQKGRPRPQ